MQKNIIPFYFQIETKLYSAYNESDAIISKILKQYCYKNPLIVVDHNIQKSSEYFLDLLSQLTCNPSLIISINTTHEPSYTYLKELTNQVRKITCDCVIGIGGGSTLDIAKTLAALKTNDGEPLSYRGFDRLENQSLPSIAIPTTAGTGSEVTYNASFVDTKTNQKMGINGRFTNPTHAILDAMWLETCPKNARISAGIDALVHAIESFICNKANPLTQFFAKEAFGLIYNSLTQDKIEKLDGENLQNLLLGSYMAGIAMTNSGSGIAAVLSYPTGVHFHVPHGICGGIFISSAIEYNIKKGFLGYASLYDIVYPQNNKTLKEKNISFHQLIKQLVDHLCIPQYLCEWGISKHNVDELLQHMIPMQAAFDQNPITFRAKEDSLAILKNHVK